MATSTVPDWNEFKKLIQLKAEPLFEKAEQLKLAIADLERQLDDTKTMLSAKMAAADAKSVMHNGFTFVWSDGGEVRSLDKDWAVKTLLQKGLTTKQIDDHTKVTTRKGSLRINSPKATEE
jgi:hypothetical protein